MVSFFAEFKIFRFWPITMDYNKAFLPKSRRFSAVLLLHSRRCYEAEICAILFLLRCPFISGFHTGFESWGGGMRVCLENLNFVRVCLVNF